MASWDQIYGNNRTKNYKLRTWKKESSKYNGMGIKRRSQAVEYCPHFLFFDIYK